jgi:hypothetical protein
MAVTDIDICAQALVMIGAEPIASFEDGTTESIACENMYENTVREEMGRYRWRFATSQQLLSRLSDDDGPATKWDAAYQLPAGNPILLMPSTVFVNDRPINFDRYEDNIFCDAAAADSVYLEGVWRVDEQFWPAYFVSIIIYRMASLLAHSVGAQVDTAELLDRRAVRQGAIARSLDAQNRTAPRIHSGERRLVDYRYRNSRITS